MKRITIQSMIHQTTLPEGKTIEDVLPGITKELEAKEDHRGRIDIVDPHHFIALERHFVAGIRCLDSCKDDHHQYLQKCIVLYYRDHMDKLQKYTIDSHIVVDTISKKKSSFWLKDYNKLYIEIKDNGRILLIALMNQNGDVEATTKRVFNINDLIQRRKIIIN